VGDHMHMWIPNSVQHAIRDLLARLAKAGV
jgi:hypothetical protein